MNFMFLLTLNLSVTQLITAPQVFLILFLAFIGVEIYIFYYFKSRDFAVLKKSIETYVNNCNDLNTHIEDLKGAYLNIKSFDYGTSSLSDQSKYNFKRSNWDKNISRPNIHNCSASVVKNASSQPFKYLCKYFDIRINEETLSNFEDVLNNFAAAEQGKSILLNERETILRSIETKIPSVIKSFAKKRLIKELGFQPVNLLDLHFPRYTFQYVSAGGNSSQRCDIVFNLDNLNKFVNYLNGLIEFKNSIQGQRALMTSKLREEIKLRDEYTCQICSLSSSTERNLLLEIDHKIPLSKGGITTHDNLQTLCWKCNRSKGSKMI